MMVITWIDRMSVIPNHKLPFPIAFAVIALTMLVVHADPAKDPTAPSELSGPVMHYTFDVREGDKVENAAGEAHLGRGWKLPSSRLKVRGRP